MNKNYGLFEKHLSRILPSTIKKFGSLDNVSSFLLSLGECGNLISAAKKSNLISLGISPLVLHRLINSDKYFSKCVDLALQCAVDRAEGVLYDRAINGYEEITYNKDNEAIAIKKKYCSKSLLEYLKANSKKYQNQSKHAADKKHAELHNGKIKDQSFRGGGSKNSDKTDSNEMTNFEVESYAEINVEVRDNEPKGITDHA